MSFSGNGLPITLEFSGGAELLVGAKKNQVDLPSGKVWTIKLLLHWIRDNLLQERPELFLDGDSVRPGILVLVNDEDWELLPSVWCIGASKLSGIALLNEYLSNAMTTNLEVVEFLQCQCLSKALSVLDRSSSRVVATFHPRRSRQ